MPSYGSVGQKTATVAVATDGANGLLSGESTPLVEKEGKGTQSADTLAKRIRFMWSKLTFQWFTPILFKGNEKLRLDFSDLDLVPFPLDCQTETVYNTFDRQWQAELALSPNGDPSLVRALWRAFGREYAAAGLLKAGHDLCLFVGPQVLHSMIVFLRSEKAPVWHGIALTVAVTCSQIAMSFCLRHYFFQCYVTGLRVRTAVALAVYRKALHLSAAERQGRTLGEITNLMSIDSQRLQDLTTYLHALWSSPLQIALALIFLWQQLGASCIGGVGVIIIMIPITRAVASWMGSMQKVLMKAKDARVELSSEVLAAMKVVKFQAWEEPFSAAILRLREVELKQLFRYYVGTSFSRMLWTFTPLAVALATFAAYVWSGHTLDVASALTSLTLFDILRFPLFMLPQVINNTVEAMVSLGRVRSFLLSQDHVPVTSTGLKENGIKLKQVSSVYSNAAKTENAAARELADKDWEVRVLKAQLDDAEQKIRDLTGQSKDAVTREEADESAKLCLRRINFECRPGELVAVVGGVGCGKTSFINAILGEVRALSGTTAVKGELAYFSQAPFIMNATIRDNVLFGHVNEPVDEKLFERALSSCSLSHDLALLPNGSRTEIGERGYTLSGGQKARIALARAVYHRGDITLIDDALAAVDAHVARELFEEAILGELMKPGPTANKRSVVLVTNALQYLSHPRVDRIVVLQEGKVVEEGSYSQLAKAEGSVFARFLSVLDETGVSGSLVEGCDEPRVSIKPDDLDELRAIAAVAASERRSDKRLMTQEVSQEGSVGKDVYLAWAQAAGGIVVPVVILVSFASVEGINILSNWWLTFWSSHGGGEQSQTKFLAVYALINCSAAAAGLVRMLLIAYFGLRASRQLFSDMLGSVLHAKMSFFDQTPVGRLVNRFSKDIYTLDEQLTTTLRTYLMVLFSVISTIVVISSITPLFTVCLLPMCIFYLNEQKFFTLTYRELKRLDSVSRSPIYALLGESVDGVAVLRAFSAEESMAGRLISMLDTQQHAYFLSCAAQSWLAVRLELIGTLIITFACLSAVLEHVAHGADETFAGLAGLAISYSLSVTQSLNWSVRMASDMEANMVAVERVQEYSQIENEGSRRNRTDLNLPPAWPLKGDVIFENVHLRYRKDLPLVLKGLNMHIPAGSKLGVVGRTGAGKSTLMVALFRLAEIEDSIGRILIDGTDIRDVGLATLRRGIAIIPQDPVLFSGTLRTNLDPFDRFVDKELYDTLEKVGLYSSKSIGSSTHSLSSQLARVESLEDDVSEGGSNFSVGQRQLIVIARALLTGAAVVLLDEATASVDPETDATIQRVLKSEFSNSTCITVAHRINSVLDSDFILVMDDGKAAEFDTPSSLLQKGGLFRELVKASQQ